MTTTSSDVGSSAVHGAALALANAIKALPEWRALADARTRFRTDPEMTAIMGRYRRVFGVWRAARARGERPADADATELAEVQLELERHPLFIGQHQATEAVIAVLQEANRALSAELGMDFAANAVPPSNRCCG